MRWIATVIAVSLFLSSIVRADELPLWEAGFGVTGISLPDYRGSNQQRIFVLPFPYIVYRGEVLRMDRKGLYGRLFNSDRVQLNLSVDGSLPVKSSQNTARTGMPDLDPTFQIGPSLEICLTSNCSGDRAVQLRLPVRAVFASDFTYLSGKGFVVNPQLNFDFLNLGSERGWNLGLALGPLFASKEYHEYYYQVDNADAIPAVRPAYITRGGYSGSLLILTLSKRFNDYWFGSFLRYDNLSGAVFSDSPLMRTKQSVMAGFAVSWVFGESQVKVQSTP
jgi:MipA family protein